MFGKRKVATLVAEFLGTGLLTLLVLNVQRSTIGVPFFVAIAAGLTLALVMFVFGNNGTGYFNPAITLGLWTARKVETLQAVTLIAMQFLGAWGAYMLYTYYVSSTLQPVGGKYVAHTLVAEAVGTFVIAIVVTASSLRAQTAAATAGFVGMAYTVGIIAASPASIGLLNPAVALGTRAWVLGTYVLGPILGALIGVNLYNMLFDDKSEVVAVSTTTSKVVKKPATKTSAAKATKVTTTKKTSVKRKTARK